MGKRINTAYWTGTRWRIDVQQDGRRKSFYSSTPGRTGQREANRKADQWLDKGIENQYQKVSQVYEIFLENKKDTTSMSNYIPMESRWRLYIKPVIGTKKVANLSKRDLQSCIDRAFSKARLSHKSLMNIRSDLTAFMKYCRDANMTSLFPEGLVLPASAARPEKNVLQPNDFLTLFSTDKTLYRGKEIHDDLIHAYRLAVLTGVRPGELRGLEWQDIKEKHIELRRSINQYQETTAGKNRNAIRSIELSAPAKKELAAQFQESANTRPDAPVFDIPSTKIYELHLARFCEYNNIPKVTPYELRHTFVSICKTLPVGLVKNLVGHSDNMDTFGVYGHELDNDSSMRTAALDSLFGKLLENCNFE